MNYLTQCCSISSIELDFELLLISTRLVEVTVDERLHGVQVEKVLGDFVIRVTQDFDG